MKDDVEITGKASEFIYKNLYPKYGNELTAEVLVREAEPVASPLHKYFEWNDTKAAHQYRLVQARKILQTIKFTVISTPVGGGTPEKSTVRVMHVITSERAPSGKSYQALPDIIKSKDKTEELLENCLKDLRAWRNKYGSIKGVIEGYSELLKRLSPRKKSNNPRRLPATQR